MKIYTKRGDQGLTDLFGGQRVSKAHIRVKAYGDIDKANSSIGLAYSVNNCDLEIKDNLLKIMKLMFCVGAEVSTASKNSAQELLDNKLKNRINNRHISYLENLIDLFETKLEPLKSFVLPCGTDLAARLHVARCEVRQAEISLINMIDLGEYVRPEICIFINRLSDLLFVMARLANYEASKLDILWNGSLED